jgi:hypothetical protein
MRFPAGMPHYAMLQGIAPFSSMTLHGIAWRSDPEYAQYSDGWMYDPVKKTVYLKLTGRQEIEEISFVY